MTCASQDCGSKDCHLCALARLELGTRHPHELANGRVEKAAK